MTCINTGGYTAISPHHTIYKIDKQTIIKVEGLLQKPEFFLFSKIFKNEGILISSRILL